MEKPIILGVGAFAHVYLAEWENTNNHSGHYKICYRPKHNRGYKSIGDIKNSDNSSLFGAYKMCLQPDHTIGFNAINEYDALVKFSHHPYIITLLDLLTTTRNFSVPNSTAIYMKREGFILDQFGFVLELIENNGYTTQEDIHLYKVPWDNVKPVIIQLLTAVDYIHQSGYRHMDLSPGNLLFTHTSTTVELRIADFGAVQPNFPNKEQEHNIVTYPYRAPEIVRGNGYNHKADNWSIGVCLYELLTGNSMLDSEDSLLRNVGEPDPDVLMKELMRTSRKTRGNGKGIKLYQRQIVINSIPRADKKCMVEIVNGLLLFDPEKRFTLQQCLDKLSYLGTSPIQSIKPRDYTQFRYGTHKYWKKDVSRTIRKLINSDMSYYHYEIIFLAMDVLERLYDGQTDETPTSGISGRMVIIATVDLSVKYYDFPLPIDCFVRDNDDDKLMIITAQRKIINRLDIFHRPTVYEQSLALDYKVKDHPEDLFSFISTHDISGMRPIDVIHYFRQKVLKESTPPIQIERGGKLYVLDHIPPSRT